MSHIAGHAMEEVRNTFQNNTEKNITGTQIGNKFGQDVNVISPISMSTDLTDKIAPFDLYQLNDLVDAATSYFGYASLDNKWLIKRFDDAAGTMRYANESNNALVLTYADAWTNRATLTYARFNELTNY